MLGREVRSARHGMNETMLALSILDWTEGAPPFQADLIKIIEKSDWIADHDAEVERKAKAKAERKYQVLRGRFEALRDEYDQRQSPPWSQAVANLIDRELNRDE